MRLSWKPLTNYGNRSCHETLFAEIFPVLDGVDHVLKSLKKWMRPQRRGIDLMNFFGASNRVIPQPLGVVGAIVPWNFPINLSFTGLIYTFAAGNRSMVKMSENSRHLAKLLIEKTPAYFPKDKLAFFDETGGVGIEFPSSSSTTCCSPVRHDTARSWPPRPPTCAPVTLELGGKSPALVCDDYSLRKAAERPVREVFNAGQICTTVDHAYVPPRQLGLCGEARDRAPALPQHHVPDFTSVIDRRAFDRIAGRPEEAESVAPPRSSWCPGPAHREDTRSRPTSCSMRRRTCQLRTAKSSARCCRSSL